MSSLSRKSLPNSHQDFERLQPIATFIESPNQFGEKLPKEFPFILDEIITQSLAPARTGRTKFSELDTQEKANIGSITEVRIRDLLGVPKGKRDMRIFNEDVDIKNTIQGNWMVPQETYSKTGGEQHEILLLCQYNDADRTCSMGLIVAREEYLRPGKNRDRKRSLSAEGMKNIWWLLLDQPLPPDVWRAINVSRFRQLRQTEKGTKRAAQFFREHLGVRIERAIVESLLYDQKDYMKRLRKNGGARDLLHKEGIKLDKTDTEHVSSDGAKRWYSFWIAEKESD